MTLYEGAAILILALGYVAALGQWYMDATQLRKDWDNDTPTGD